MQTLPLFPLGSVLFPGVVLPLHVFEPRYQVLVRRLLDAPEGTRREFGVVAIRQGWEIGTHGVGALYDVGCTAELRRVERYDDGTFDLVTVGRERFMVGRLDAASAPYLSAEIQWLPERMGPAEEAAVLAGSVVSVFGSYLEALAEAQQLDVTAPELPDEPMLLGNLVAATAPLALADQQALLAAPDGAARLRAELRLLKRETTMLRRLRAVPIPLADLQVPQSRN